RQALLPARSPRQGRAHRREAGSPRRRRGRPGGGEGSGVRLTVMTAGKPRRGVVSRLLALGVVIFFASIAVAEPLVLEIASAQHGFDKRLDEPVVTFKLKNPSKRMFTDFTAQNVGRKTEFRVDGQIVMKGHIIREPILGGVGRISGGLTVEQAKEI